MARPKKNAPALTLVPDETLAETVTSPTQYRVKGTDTVGTHIGDQAGMMRIQFADGEIMHYAAEDLEPAEAPVDGGAPPPPSPMSRSSTSAPSGTMAAPPPPSTS